MKKTVLQFTIFLACFLISCGGKKSTKSVDIPPYTVGNGSYFDNKTDKNSFALYGKADGNFGRKKFGSYTNGSQLSGLNLHFGDDTFIMLKSGVGSILDYTNDVEYSMHVLVTKFNEDNPYNSGLISEHILLNRPAPSMIEINYSDSYYFYKDEDFMDAKQYIETLEKKENQSSKFVIDKDSNKTKTYKAKIEKVVEYFGIKNLKSDKFFSLYLDCGAVVQLNNRNLWKSQLIGKTIDCITSDDNVIIEYELIK